MKESKLKVLLDGIVRIIQAIKCKLTCCKSSCNATQDTISDRSNSPHKEKYI